MNWGAIRSIARRDLTVVARSRAVSMPLIVLPVIFFVLLPALVILLSRAAGTELGDADELLAQLPPEFRTELAGLEPAAQLVVWALEYAFVTLFLIVPLMTATVIAADSFAGEKERKTLEALIYTPTTDLELYVGKILGPWGAAVTIGTVGFVGYAIVSNLLGADFVGRPLVITPRWLLTVVLVGPGVAALGVAALVQVSARVRGFQEAYQLGGLVVLPLVALLIGQLGGVLYLGPLAVLLLGIGVWAVAAFAIVAGFRAFRRERLLQSG